jgi:CHAT domain-containing protein
MKLKSVTQFLPRQRFNQPAFKLLFLFIITFILTFLFQFLPKNDWQPVQATEVNYQSNKSLGLTQNTSQNSAESLLEQGINAYQAQRFSKAIEVWKNALNEFQANSLKQALILNYLSLAYQKLGQWMPAESTISRSLQLLNANQSLEKLPILARSLSTYSRLQLELGKTLLALESLQKATTIYEKIGDAHGKIGSLMNQAQALQSLGSYRQALKTLHEVETTLQNQPVELKALGLMSLGNTLRLVGDLDQSWCVLQRGLEVAKQSDSSHLIGNLLFSLGHTAHALGNRDKNSYKNSVIGQQAKPSEVLYQCNKHLNIESNALGFYKQAQTFYQQAGTQFSGSSNANIQTSLAQLKINLNILNTQEWKEEWPTVLQESNQLWHHIETQISSLAASQFSIYSNLNLAEDLIQLQEYFFNQPAFSQSSQIPTVKQIENLLQTALQQAQELNDHRAESISFGYFGQLYQHNQALSKAKDLTQTALNLALSYSQSDITYQWQWQLGQILKAEGNQTEAISAYMQAVDSLQDVRQNLVGIDLDFESTQADFRFYFQEEVEPVYRELVDLLLTSEPSPEKLKTALAVMEIYQISELENFLHCQLPQVGSLYEKNQLKNTSQLLSEKLDQIHKIDPNAALVYPILLNDRIEIIISYPDQTIQHYSSLVNRQDVERVIYNFRLNIEDSQNVASLEQIQLDSQQIYQWLFQQPAEDFAEQNIKILVFVLDGSLRTIPMPALYNPLTNQYLIETYSTALSPGLLQLNLQKLAQPQTKSLLAGSTKSFPPDFPNQLPAVQQELTEIQALIPNSKLFLNQNFTWENVQKTLKFSDFSQLHIATHGKFSSTPQQTYLLDFKNQPLTLDGLDHLLQSQTSIDLLTLSACETAAGDNRAILGLAGVAVKSQASSTLAGLWKVDDLTSAQLMIRFYQHLKAGQTKAEALRLAQLSLLQTSSKFYFPSAWSSYVIVGNWL